MPAGRFVLLDTPLTARSKLDLPADVAHQVRDVLRLAPGGVIHLLDGRGATYPAEVVAVERRRVVVRLGERQEPQEEFPCRVTLALGMLKAAKFEWVLQKATLAAHSGGGGGAVWRRPHARIGRAAFSGAGAGAIAAGRDCAVSLGSG